MQDTEASGNSSRMLRSRNANDLGAGSQAKIRTLPS
jgi:hypothetical protein